MRVHFCHYFPMTWNTKSMCVHGTDIRSAHDFSSLSRHMALYGSNLWLVTPPILSNFFHFWFISEEKWGPLHCNFQSVGFSQSYLWRAWVQSTAVLVRSWTEKREKKKKTHTISLRFCASCMMDSNEIPACYCEGAGLFHQMLLSTLTAADWYNWHLKDVRNQRTNIEAHEMVYISLWSRYPYPLTFPLMSSAGWTHS